MLRDVCRTTETGVTTNELMAEVLTAVGRVRLQSACLRLLCEMRSLSINMPRLCHEPIWLQKGQPYMMSDTAETGLQQAINLVIKASMESMMHR